MEMMAESQNQNYIYEYMQEINDLIVRNLYINIFGNAY